MENFSQNNEQQVILDYFGDHIGTFCSLGENDGIHLSNVRALALKGWRGVMIEPMEEAFLRLKELYKGHKGFYCYDYAIHNHNGRTILNSNLEHLGKGDVGLLSTTNPSEMQRWKGVEFIPVEVDCFKWKTAINRWSIRTFDFISIDIEGDEMKVLPDMDLTDTKLFCIEWNSKPELKTEYEKYLEGFKLIYTSGENLIYAR